MRWTPLLLLLLACKGGDTDKSDTDVTGTRYHADNFAEPAIHGAEMSGLVEDCRDCHGDDLSGGWVDVSCDSCHTENWRQNCTYCHGGTDNTSGAPPREPVRDPPVVRFTAHSAHIDPTRHPPYGCNQCHVPHADVLDAGHIFDDDTPNQGEADFSRGLSPDAAWDGAGGCSNLYCHGNGRSTNGSYSTDQATPDCQGCHANGQLGGQHGRHSREQCASCHGTTVNANNQISGPTMHVNGQADVFVSQSLLKVTGSNGNYSCTGYCHGGGHWTESW